MGKPIWLMISSAILLCDTAAAAQTQVQTQQTQTPQTTSAATPSSPAPSSPAAASTAQTPATNSASPTGDIIVTATRREQALQDVPIAITALTAASLGAARINTSADLMQVVPNLNITSSVGAVIIYLRGVGQTATNPGQEPSVATYVDGVYQPTVFGALTGLANVQRVEVIKGPQGTLFGRNATGGLINITTRDPSHTPTAELSASYGNFDTVKLTGYGSLGITQDIAADLSVYYNDEGKGVGHNETTDDRLRGTRNIDVRSKVLINATDTTTVRLAGSYTDNRSSVGNALAVLPGTVAADGSTALRDFYDIQASIDPSDHNRTWQVSGKVVQELDPFDITSITSYTNTKDEQLYDVDGTPTPLINVHLTQNDRVFTQELQIGSKKGGKLTWIFGAFYYNSIGHGQPTGTQLTGLAFAPLGGYQFRGNLKTESYAVFGEGTYEILPKLNLTIGGRYTIDKKTLNADTRVLDTEGAILETIPLPRASKTYKDPTYRAILDYHFTTNTMAYASYSRGFKSGGYDTGNPNGIPFNPEKIDAYEVGVKTELFDRTLRLNAAAFYYDYNNLQLPILVNNNGVASQVTVNAANSTVKGIDLDGSLRIGHNLHINFGAGYLDSKYKNFTDAPCTGLDATRHTIEFVCDVSGNSLIHAPKTTFNLGASYVIPSNVGNFALNGSYSRQSTSYFDVADRLAQSPYALVNGQISWAPDGNRYSIALFVENLTNKKYTISQFALAGLGDTYAAGRPRMYGVEIRAKY